MRFVPKGSPITARLRQVSEELLRELTGGFWVPRPHPLSTCSHDYQPAGTCLCLGLCAPLGWESPEHVLCAGSQGHPWDRAQLPSLGPSQAIRPHFHILTLSLVFLEVSSQINYLHSNPASVCRKPKLRQNQAAGMT